MELEKEFKESAHKLVDGENITYLKIEFKVGLEKCEVNAGGNILGFILLESLGVEKDKVIGLIEEIIKPATTQFNAKITDLVREKHKKDLAEFKEKHNG